VGFPARTPRTESPRWKSKWTNEKKVGLDLCVDSWENITYLKQLQALRSLFERMKAKLLNVVGSIRGDSPCHPAGPQTSEPVSINRA